MLRHEAVEAIQEAVCGIPLLQETRAVVPVQYLRADGDRRRIVAREAERAVDNGDCQRIDSGCIFCARERIDCDGVRAIVIDVAESAQPVTALGVPVTPPTGQTR